MIATALKLHEAPQQALFSEPIGMMGAALVKGREHLTQEQFMELLFEYSATLASLTSAFVTQAVLTEEQLSDLLATINEMEEMGNNAEME